MTRIEPTTLEELPRDISDLVAEISSRSERLGLALHPRPAAELATLVRIMNAYYSNLIEGHNTRPRDIERALAGDLDDDAARRDLQREAVAHVRVQQYVDELGAQGQLREPASAASLRDLHRRFYAGGPAAMLEVDGARGRYTMIPGVWRMSATQDVAIGRLIPPSSPAVPKFMTYFEERFRLGGLGKSSRIVAMAIAHHRLNFIHPFPDGNGRVSRLMSHAMGHVAGVGAHGLWSISRGLARGLAGRDEYRTMMDAADAPRENDRDGRGNLSRRALRAFVVWFLSVALDQITFMTEQFDLQHLSHRMRLFVESDDRLRIETADLLEEALSRGSFERGDAARILRMPERSARRIMTDAIDRALLGSDTPKGPVSLRFGPAIAEAYFPRLFGP